MFAPLARGARLRRPDALSDPIAETLIVYRWTEKGYLLVLDAQGEERVSPEPFEAATFSVHGLLDGDEEDE